MRRLVTSAAAAAFAFSCAASAHAADPCPNAQFRTGTAAGLPDCRAYEQVSPVDKNGVNVSPFNPVSSTGSRVTYSASGALPGSDSAAYVGLYASERGDDWSTRGVDPPERADSSPRGVLVYTGTLAVSDDLLSAVMVTTRKLTAGAVEGDSNVYLRDLRDGSFQLLFTVPGAFTVADRGVTVRFGGAPDARRVAIATSLALTPDAVDGRSTLYSWQGGALRLESKLPDGQQAEGGLAALLGLSTDGRRLTYTLNLPVGTPAYQRVGDKTVLISRSHRRKTDQDAPASVSTTLVSPDGRLVVFQSGTSDPLTDDSPPGDLSRAYRWTADDDGLADVLAGVTDVDAGPQPDDLSPDGRYLWFTSYRQLTDDAPDQQTNLYVLDGSTSRLSFVAPNAGGGSYSPSGNVKAFTSDPPLTPSAGRFQLYTFDAANPGAGVTCASCGATGADASPVSVLTRAIADDGRVFFDSPDRLVGTDSNRLADVYGYAPGHGLSLISSGAADTPAQFFTISPSGDDVLFLTGSSLVGQDVDALIDLYDARVGGGIAAQQSAPTLPSCTGDGCRVGAQAPDQLRSSPPAQPELAVPSFSVRAPSAAARRRAARTGRLALAVRVSTGGKVTVRARARVRDRTRTVASGSRTTTRARTVTVALRLSERARRQLRRRGTLAVAVTARFSRVTGAKTVQVALERASTRGKGGSR